MLTDCCARDSAETVAFPPLHNFTACALARHGLSGPVAVCVHVHGLLECNDFDQALCARDTFQVLGDAFHVHLVALSGTKDLSCFFFQAVHDVSALLTHVLQLSHGCRVHGSFLVFRFSFSSSTSDSVVGVFLTFGVATGLEASRPSTAVTSRMYFGFASAEYPPAVLTITLLRKNI